MSEPVRVGEWLNLLVALAFFGGMFWLFWKSRRRKRKAEPVPDGPADEPYRVFTSEFDLELPGREADQRLISTSPDYARGWLKLGKDQWRREVELADELLDQQRQVFEAALGKFATVQDAAVTLLVDQSGSMRGEPMRWAAVACRLAAEALAERGCDVEILGFSTAGWQGGSAYEKWKGSGRPKRPGRICALAHLIYKPFAQRSLEREDWEAMLNPNVLRENVDGEALRWAAGRLKQAAASRRYLVIVSDGAPVDDATLMHNGLGYLTKDLKRVIAELEGDTSLSLSAIGILHPVSEYYRTSVGVDDVTQLPAATAKWLGKITEQ